MEAVKHNKGFARKVGVPQSVGADFSAANKSEGVSYSSLPEHVGKKQGAALRRSK